eukprot:m.66943 g.66943  ORF g.66943 m.66943 type:complete len:97 (-) comp13794_c0_seq3:43-333(-)
MLTALRPVCDVMPPRCDAPCLLIELEALVEDGVTNHLCLAQFVADAAVMWVNETRKTKSRQAFCCCCSSFWSAGRFKAGQARANHQQKVGKWEKST